MEKLRQAIASRIPPLTDADWDSMDAASWDRLESAWGNQAERKTKEGVDYEEMAKNARQAAAQVEAITQRAKQLRGNPQAYAILDKLLLMTLAAAVKGERVVYDMDKFEEALLTMRTRPAN